MSREPSLEDAVKKLSEISAIIEENAENDDHEFVVESLEIVTYPPPTIVLKAHKYVIEHGYIRPEDWEKTEEVEQKTGMKLEKAALTGEKEEKNIMFAKFVFEVEEQ